MTTELVWSTVKPTFPEVKDKCILIMYADGSEPDSVIINNEVEYNYWLNDPDCEFKGCAILDLPDLTAPVSPLPLIGGCKVIIVQNTPDNAYQWGFVTKEDAERAWNRIAEALNEVER